MKKARLETAIKLYGGQTQLAKVLGINQQNISYWLKEGIPTWREKDIEAAIASAPTPQPFKPGPFVSKAGAA